VYKSRVCAPLLRCISHNEGVQLLKKIHGVVCGSDNVTIALIGKAFQQGFYVGIDFER